MRSTICMVALCVASAPGAVRWEERGEIGTPARKAMEAFERDAPAGGDLTVTVRQSPGASESFEIAVAAPGRIQVTGGDATGLAYGLYELLGQLETNTVEPRRRSPDTRRRGMSVFLYNQDLESAWLYDRAYWERYFELLLRSRLNHFTLIFGHQTSYLAPPFPFLVDVPGYERVRPTGVSEQQRTRNLDMLRMVSEMAGQYGIRFIFGIWQQHAHLYGKNMVEGLSYDDLFDYCPRALARVLKECPGIQGVQFRMNIESGIEEDDQNRFYSGMANAIRQAGRSVDLDFRAKGLRPETIDSAIRAGIRPIVSTKYWREHMGLPFHSTRIDASDKERSYRRYGYWDLLPQQRPYDVFYRMWTLGSTKLLLWGSLDYARQFSRSSQFGDSIGFDVCAPLSQKGFGNWKGGNWRIFAEPGREYFRWEFERYWAYYLSFGLAGYSRESHQPVLEASFRRRFGPAGAAIREAYESASWVIPFITSVRAVSASNFGYWPETETGGLTERYLAMGTGDDNLFYRVDEYAGDLLSGSVSAKMTPGQMAARLESYADRTEHAMKRAGLEASGPEFRSTQVDFAVLASLARYHASRLRSAVDYALFQRGGERFRLRRAGDSFAAAVRRWREIVRLTDGVYNPNMVFNRPPDQIGHWKDELPMLEAEERRILEIDKLYPAAVADPETTLKKPLQRLRYKLVMRWKEENGTLSRWAETEPVEEPAGAPVERYSMRSPGLVLRDLIEAVRYRRILHVPERWIEGGRLVVHASLTGSREGARLRLFHRGAGAGFEFNEVEMKEAGENVYQGSVDGIGGGERVLYYLRADAGTAFYSGSAKEPHELIARANGARSPAIRSTPPSGAKPGQPVTVYAEVQSERPLAVVRLLYRHLDQSENWRSVAMLPAGKGRYEATIPGEFVVPGWDLMYAIEAVDGAGLGTLAPEWEKQDPAYVIPVSK